MKSTGASLAGDHIVPPMDEMYRRGFRFINTRHEQGVVDIANAWGRITGTHGEYVERADQLGLAPGRALAAGGPAVVNVRMVPSPSPLTKRILEAKDGDD